MSDLRTRIAAVADAYFDMMRREQGYIVDGVTGDELADALIRELSADVLQYVGATQRFILGAGPQKLQREVLPDGRYRYVTEWTTD